MRRSKELIEDHLGTACTHFAYPWSVGLGRRRPSGQARLPDGSARCVDDQPGRRMDPYRLGRVPILRSDGRFFFRRKVHASSTPRRGFIALSGVDRGGERDEASGRAHHDGRPEPAIPPAPAACGAARCRFDVTTISAPGPVGRGHRGRGHPSHPVAGRDACMGPSADVRAFRELLAIFRRERFDLVHTHNPKPGVIRTRSQPASPASRA